MTKNVTLSIDEDLLEKAREILSATGKTVNQGFREYLQHIAGEADLDREIAAFRQRACQGNSQGWKWNREDAYEGRLEWPRR
ncbi:MAG TPA: hypothetical protein VGJ21_18755 [Terracidiphilus sp.]